MFVIKNISLTILLLLIGNSLIAQSLFVSTKDSAGIKKQEPLIINTANFNTYIFENNEYICDYKNYNVHYLFLKTENYGRLEVYITNNEFDPWMQLRELKPDAVFDSTNPDTMEFAADNEGLTHHGDKNVLFMCAEAQPGREYLFTIHGFQNGSYNIRFKLSEYVYKPSTFSTAFQSDGERKYGNFARSRFMTKAHFVKTDKIWLERNLQDVLLVKDRTGTVRLELNGVHLPALKLSQAVTVYYYLGPGDYRDEYFILDRLETNGKYFFIEETARTTTDLWLRKEPGLNSTTIQVIPSGDSVTVLEKGMIETINDTMSAWVKVRLSNGITGWCFGGRLMQ